MRETWVQSLGWEDPWRWAEQPTPVFLPRESPWTEEPGGLQSMGSQRVRLDWVTKYTHLQTGKGVCESYILSPCLFHFYAEYIMRSAGLDETQAGIMIARRNNKNLRYVDDTTLMKESKEELKSLLMKVKEESEKLD